MLLVLKDLKLNQLKLRVKMFGVAVNMSHYHINVVILDMKNALEIMFVHSIKYIAQIVFLNQ